MCQLVGVARPAAELNLLGGAEKCVQPRPLPTRITLHMATAFTHAFVALAAGRACFPESVPRRFWFLAPFCSAIPDADVGLHSYGVEYEDLWGHRGMTHSLIFALILALVVVTWLFRDNARWLSRRWCALVAFFFAITASHGLIDAVTDGGLGIAFFAPFNNERYFMPWHPLPVSQFGLPNLFTSYALHVLLHELLFVWLPLTIVCLPIYLIRRRRVPCTT